MHKGMEKCERNVLPVLNNLLENREMTLEDGRFLMSPSRYDSLLKTYPRNVEQLTNTTHGRRDEEDATCTSAPTVSSHCPGPSCAQVPWKPS